MTPPSCGHLLLQGRIQSSSGNIFNPADHLDKDEINFILTGIITVIEMITRED